MYFYESTDSLLSLIYLSAGKLLPMSECTSILDESFLLEAGLMGSSSWIFSLYFRDFSTRLGSFVACGFRTVSSLMYKTDLGHVDLNHHLDYDGMKTTCDLEIYSSTRLSIRYLHITLLACRLIDYCM